MPRAATGSRPALAGALSDLLDAPLVEVVARSFVDRIAGRAGSELNLANAFWSPGTPRNVEEAIERIGLTGLNVIVRVHDRIRDIDPSLWREIRYIRNVWWGGSAGFKVVWEDPAMARDRLDGSWGRVARDGLFGALEHQRRPALSILADMPIARWLDRAAALPDCITWRELSPLGAESLHFCVGRHEPRDPGLDDVHLDWRSPVRGVDAGTRRCMYARRAGAHHWLQAMQGEGAPRFVFDAMEALIAAFEARRAERGLDEAALEAWDDLVHRWDTVCFRLAARGAEGATRAALYLWEAEQLSAELTERARPRR
ncbi:Hypothetical protein A7982_05451 [Minicystis rosea]|nr:Hypothetical protein A7982_05451 [Minicystis rosea]